jgi:hypothetical protein
MILGMADHSTWQSSCRLCIALCGIEVDTEDGRADARPDHNVNILISGRDIDPLTGMPRQSGMAIGIRPVSEVAG